MLHTFQSFQMLKSASLDKISELLTTVFHLTDTQIQLLANNSLFQPLSVPLAATPTPAPWRTPLHPGQCTPSAAGARLCGCIGLAVAHGACLGWGDSGFWCAWRLFARVSNLPEPAGLLVEAGFGLCSS